MFGLTFLNSIYLWTLLAAPLPILIHLFQRRRARVVEWSSLDFMKPFQRPRTRKVDLRRLLLLLLRVLILVLLSLAISRPTLPGGAPGADAPSAAVVILDCSLSMGTRDPEGEGTLFVRAREEAAGILQLMRKGDRAALLLASDPGSFPSRLSDNIAALEAELREAEPGEGRADWADALAAALELLRASPQPNREIYLVSDMQRSGWEEIEDQPVTAGELASSLAEAGIRLYPVPVGPLPAQNLSLEELRLIPSGGPGGGDLLVRARLRNQGQERAQGVAVELVMEDGQSTASVVTIGPGETVWTALEAKSPPREFIGGRVEIPADDLPGDNVRFFARRRPEPHRVLLLGRPTPSTPEGLSSYYLRRALAPGPGAGPFLVDETAIRDVTPTLVKNARVIILADCEKLGPGTLAALKKQVYEGSGLIIFLGPGTDLGYMNQTLFPGFLDLALEGPPDGPGTRTAGEDDPSAWGTSNDRHPIFRVFDSPPAEALARVRFTRCVHAIPGEGVEVLASFTNGLPALLEGTHGEGHILLFTSSSDLSWGDFPRAGNFVPFIHESVGYLARVTGEPPADHPAGERIKREILPAEDLTTRVGTPGLGLTIKDPRGRVTPVVPEVTGRRTFISVSLPAETGIYRVEREEETVDLFAVNADPRESDTAVLALTEFARLLHPARVSGAAAGENLVGLVYAARYGRELASTLLWLAFFLLVAELALRGGFALRGSAEPDAREPARDAS